MFTPYKDYLFVNPVKEEKVVSGLVMTQTNQSWLEGTIVSVSPEMKDDYAKKGIEVGTTVIFDTTGAYRMNMDGIDGYVIDEEIIIGTVTK